MNKTITVAIISIFVLFYCMNNKTTIRNSNNQNTVIVAFGDSLTYGHGVEQPYSYPSLLSRATGKRVINLGVNGETSEQGLNRIEEVLQYKPKLVIVEFGANDFFRHIDFERTKRNISLITDKIQSSGSMAAIASFGGNPLTGNYTEAFKKIAKEKNAIFIPDIMDGIFGKKELLSDNFHPNQKGYKIIQEKVLKHIKPYI